MCAFVKRLFVSHIGLARIVLLAAVGVTAVSQGLPQNLAAADPPRYKWETVLPDDEYFDLDIPYGIRINSYGDAVGRGRKLVSVDFSTDLEQWNEDEDVQVAAFRYLNSPSVLDAWGYVESVADWGTLVDRDEWPVTQLPAGTWMRYPIIKAAEPGHAWKITSIRDINAHREMVGHARSYSYCADDERYVRASSMMIWLTIDPDAEQGSQLSIVDLQPLLEEHESGIDWSAIRIMGVRATNDSKDLAISYRPDPNGQKERGLYARYKDEDGMYTVVDIGDLGHGTVFVRGMNNWGQIVGEAYIDSSTTRAFRWSPGDGQMEDLGCLLNNGRSRSRAINDWGQVVGASDKRRIGWSTLNESTAFRYSDGVGMVDLVNSKETTRGTAEDINSNGDTIGNATRDGVQLPFVYTDETGFLELEPLIENLPDELGRFAAWRITDNGEIFLSHDQLPDGRTELVILRPIGDSPPGNGEEPGEPGLGPFFSTDTPMTIADAHPRQGARDTVSTITISDTGTEVDSLLLLVDITHGEPGQLSGELVDPDGNKFVLFGPGVLKEDGPLDFNVDVSRSLDGAWKLILRDHVRGVTGTLNGWAIIGVVGPSP